MDLVEEISFSSGKIKLSKLKRGSTDHSCADRESYSDKIYIFSVHHHSEAESYSESYSWRLPLVGSSPDFGPPPAGQSFVPQWLDPTHLTACMPASGLCNKET